MITLEANERIEICTAVGSELRINHRLVSGTASVIASALEYGKDDTLNQQRRKARRTLVINRLRERVAEAVADNRLTRAQANRLREELADGNFSVLPDSIKERISDFFTERPIEPEVNSNASRTIIRVPRGSSKGRTVLMMVEVVAGSEGAVVEILGAEVTG